MNRVLNVDQARARHGRRSYRGREGTVSVLRWPAGRSDNGVLEMFGAQEAGRLGALEPESPDSAPDRENVLLVSASRRVAPDTPAVHLTLVNTSPSRAVKLSVKLAGRQPTSLAGTVLTMPAMAARKGCKASSVPQPAVFHGAVLRGKTVETTVPARSVVVLTLRLPGHPHEPRRGSVSEPRPAVLPSRLCADKACK